MADDYANTHNDNTLPSSVVNGIIAASNVISVLSLSGLAFVLFLIVFWRDYRVSCVC